MKLLTRKRKPVAAIAENLAYDATAVAPALAEGRWAVPDRFNYTRDVVEVLARDPKRRALNFLGNDGVIEPRSFHRLAEGAARWATLLREKGVEPGDRVLVLAQKTPAWLEVMLGAIKVGAVSVPCPETMTAASLQVRLAGAGANVVVAGVGAEEEAAKLDEETTVLLVQDMRSLAHSLPEEAPTHDTGARDPAFILTTAGTASGPRGVVHTHGAAFAARVAAEHWLDAGPSDAVWCTADASSGTAVWNALLGPWSRGAELVLHQGSFDPLERLDCIRRLDTTILCQTPAEYRALLAAADIGRYRPPRLRRLVSTGEHLSPDIIAAYEEAWDLTICDGYGQVETGVVVANGAGPGFQAGSVGVPLPGFDVAVVDEQGNELEPGAIGELAVRGKPPTLFSAYWEAPDETKAAFRGDTYVTGDTASCDDDGFLWFLGRAEDVILSGGGRFGPVEVEEALTHHAAVAEAAVVGMRDLQRGGHYARAFVVLASGFEPSDRLVAEIRESSRQSLAGHQVPREIEFVDALPTTADGKVKRQELRERPATPVHSWSPPPAPTLVPELPTESEPEPQSVAAGELTVVEQPPMPSELAPVYEDVVEPVAPPERVPYVEPAPVPYEPEPVAYVEEPVPYVEPEPTVAESAAYELEPTVVEPEPTVAEPAAYEPPVYEPPAYEPEPTVVEPEPEPVPEPTAEVAPTVEWPEASPSTPDFVEPEPVVEPESVVEPEAAAEPAYEPIAPAEPEHDEIADLLVTAEPEATAPAPEPPPAPEPAPQQDDIADLLVAPGAETSAAAEQSDPEPAPVAEVVPHVDPAPELTASEELPDYVVQDEQSTNSTGLAFPRVTDLNLNRSDSDFASEEREAKPPRERPDPDRRSGKDRRRQSSHDPGDEAVESDWMQGLSNRLSAYSLSEEAPRPVEPPDES